jgi:transcription initiation factor IIE alpha subunit
MEMGSKYKVEEITSEGEIYTCPNCSYPDGFHVSFKVKGKTRNAEIYLICPNCHRRFRINWQTDLSGS